MNEDKDNANPYINNHKYTSPTNRKVRNPFDRALIEKLHKPICSPGMCKIYKRKNNGIFRWEIDQACTLVPVDIVACNSQFDPSPDPVLEKIAEEATDRFFSQEVVIPSPLESSKKVKPLLVTSDTSLEVTGYTKEKTVVMRDVSVQTVLTLPPELPPEVEKVLQPFCTFTQDQNISGEYEITANGSLRRKLFFEEHSDMEHYDSEQTDDEQIHVEQCPPPSYESHRPVVYSSELVEELIGPRVTRTFDTPLNKIKPGHGKPYRNKILDSVDLGEPCFSPIEFHTPKRQGHDCVDGATTSSSLASVSISPVTKITSSDEEKNNFTSPESEAMATCLDCIKPDPQSEKKGPCFCKSTSNKSFIKRSVSLKGSPVKTRKTSVSFSEKRSLSMSSLNRSRSVQKLDFSMDMSIDESLHDSSQADAEYSPSPEKPATWSIVEETSVQHIIKVENFKEQLQHTQTLSQMNCDNMNIIDETPTKGKCKSIVRSHEISKIRAPFVASPMNMSLDNSLDNVDNPLNLEDKKIDFNKVDLKYLTDDRSQFEYTTNVTKLGDDNSNIAYNKRLDSGYNENTFYTNYTNMSSYYESAIKPSELTVTNAYKINNSKAVLKEISNMPWMRVDSGFKDENSSDSMQFYASNDNSIKNVSDLHFSEAKVENKENAASEDYDRFLTQASSKTETMSMSDIFTEDMTFTCNFSSTPSKIKTRKVNS